MEQAYTYQTVYKPHEAFTMAAPDFRREYPWALLNYGDKYARNYLKAWNSINGYNNYLSCGSTMRGIDDNVKEGNEINDLRRDQRRSPLDCGVWKEKDEQFHIGSEKKYEWKNQTHSEGMRQETGTKTNNLNDYKSGDKPGYGQYDNPTPYENEMNRNEYLRCNVYDNNASKQVLMSPDDSGVNKLYNSGRQVSNVDLFKNKTQTNFDNNNIHNNNTTDHVRYTVNHHNDDNYNKIPSVVNHGLHKYEEYKEHTPDKYPQPVNKLENDPKHEQHLNSNQARELNNSKNEQTEAHPRENPERSINNPNRDHPADPKANTDETLNNHSHGNAIHHLTPLKQQFDSVDFSNQLLLENRKLIEENTKKDLYIDALLEVINEELVTKGADPLEIKDWDTFGPELRKYLKETWNKSKHEDAKGSTTKMPKKKKQKLREALIKENKSCKGGFQRVDTQDEKADEGSKVNEYVIIGNKEDKTGRKCTKQQMKGRYNGTKIIRGSKTQSNLRNTSNVYDYDYYHENDKERTKPCYGCLFGNNINNRGFSPWMCSPRSGKKKSPKSPNAQEKEV